MTCVVLDSSALLALLNNEPGADEVEQYLSDSILSCVNLSEVLTILHRKGIPESKARNIVYSIINNIIPFDKEHAELTAFLYTETKSLGLSFGDRACIALGLIRNIPIVTADKIWSKLKINVDIKLIR